MIDLPAKIVTECFFKYIGCVREIHDDVMLEALGADAAQQLLQFRHMCDGAIAKGLQVVVGELALPNIGADGAIVIVGGESTKSQRPGWSASIERAVGVLNAQDAAQNRPLAILMSGKNDLAQLPQWKRTHLSSSSP